MSSVSEQIMSLFSNVEYVPSTRRWEISLQFQHSKMQQSFRLKHTNALDMSKVCNEGVLLN